MKRLFLSILMLLLLNCSKQPEVYIPFLEGYWEIHEVTLPDGSKKIYDYNDTIDYIALSDSLTGFRKKLKPNLTGGYQTSKDVETFQLKIENDSLNVYYSTPFAHWKETIVSASENELLIINNAKVRYLYKRFQPLNLNDEQTP
jgi:hypothetical protein